MNTYNYAGNKPITYYDIDGMQSSEDDRIEIIDPDNPVVEEKEAKKGNVLRVEDGLPTFDMKEINIYGEDIDPNLQNAIALSRGEKPPFPGLISEAKSSNKSFLEIEVKSEYGLAGGGKLKLFGFGGELKLGISKTKRGVTVSEDGTILESSGKSEPELSADLGAKGIGFKTSISKSESSIGGYAGPFEINFQDSQESESRFTIFEFGLLTVLGGSIKISIPINNHNINAEDSFTKTETRSDNTKTQKPNFIIQKEMMRNLDFVMPKDNRPILKQGKL